VNECFFRYRLTWVVLDRLLNRLLFQKIWFGDRFLMGQTLFLLPNQLKKTKRQFWLHPHFIRMQRDICLTVNVTFIILLLLSTFIKHFRRMPQMR